MKIIDFIEAINAKIKIQIKKIEIKKSFNI